jgi:hypothetical protein
MILKPLSKDHIGQTLQNHFIFKKYILNSFLGEISPIKNG